MSGDRDYLKDCSSMNQWNPVFNRLQSSKPGVRIYRPPMQREYDNSSIIFTPQLKTMFDVGFDFIHGMAKGIITHPFVVLRRQCQVQVAANKYHIVPYTLVPVVFYLHRNQGVSVLWKGIGSVCLIKTMMLFVEDIISCFTSWPKIVNIFESKWKDIWHHILLKCWSLALVAPYYAAALPKSVQSEIAREMPNPLEVLRNGSIRLLHLGTPRRMLPIWSLVLPYVAIGISKHIVTVLVKQTSERCLFYYHSNENWMPDNNIKRIIGEQNQELHSTLLSYIIADTMFYPGESLMNRCMIQGTGTIIDDLDTGKTVVAVLTNYRGVMDCYRTCTEQEGPLGFYRGFGSVIMHYTSYIVFVHFARKALLALFVSIHKRNNSPPVSVQMLPGTSATLNPSDHLQNHQQNVNNQFDDCL